MSAATAANGYIPQTYPNNNEKKQNFKSFKAEACRIFKKGVQIVVNEVGNGGTVNAVAKFARRFFEFLAAFEAVTAFFGPAGTFFKNFSEVYKVLTVFKSGQEFILADKVRVLASSLLGITISMLSLAKIMDAFGWVNIANISAAFGRIAVIGSLAVIPLGTFISWLEGLKATIDISLAISKLVDTASKIVDVNKKVRFWKTSVDLEKCKEKIRHYNKEGSDLLDQISVLEKQYADLDAKAKHWEAKKIALDEKIAAKKAKLEQQGRIGKCFSNTFGASKKILPSKTNRQYKKWSRLSKKVDKKLTEKRTALQALQEKRVVWRKFAKRYADHIDPSKEGRYEKDRKAIGEMQKAKLKKWKDKKFNLRTEQLRNVANIVMNIAIITLVIGGTIMFFVGLAMGPIGGPILPFLLPALGLTIATFGLGMHFFKMYKGKKTKKVPLAELTQSDSSKRKLLERQKRAIKEELARMERERLQRYREEVTIEDVDEEAVDF